MQTTYYYSEMLKICLLLVFFNFEILVTDASNDGHRIHRTFTDPDWPQMWHLNRGPGFDMGIMEAWNEGMTGKGVVISILDDGLEINHPDIVQNYDPQASYDYIDDDRDPTHDYRDSTNYQGTRCAGVVASQPNNVYCGVGIAYEASIGGIKLLGGSDDDSVEAKSLSHNIQHIDIYSMSWGPNDDGSRVDGPGDRTLPVIVNGITNGRHGFGSIFVFASGTGGRQLDNCNCDGYVNSMYTIAVNSASGEGKVPWYAESCSSILAATYGSGMVNGIDRKITTTHIHGSCTSVFAGTSVSAPMASAIIALALQANPTLTWRDVQQLIIQTAQPTQLNVSDWTTNGVGRQFSHYFGYGLMDAGAMVKTARKWITLPPRMECSFRINLPHSNPTRITRSGGTMKFPFKIEETTCPEMRYLEHVQARLTITSYSRRGDISINITSALGTRSTLLTRRPHDDTGSPGFADWPFMTMHFWGENPHGEWVLEIQNHGSFKKILTYAKIFVYGTATDPNHVGSGPVSPSGSTESSNVGTTKKEPVTDDPINADLDKFTDQEFEPTIEHKGSYDEATTAISNSDSQEVKRDLSNDINNSDGLGVIIEDEAPSYLFWIMTLIGVCVMLIICSFLMYKFVKSRRSVSNFSKIPLSDLGTIND